MLIRESFSFFDGTKFWGKWFDAGKCVGAVTFGRFFLQKACTFDIY